MVVRIKNYEEYKKKFMEETDPEKGSKIAIILKDFCGKELTNVEILKGIDEKYIKYALFFGIKRILLDNKKIMKMIIFDKATEYPEATKMIRVLLMENEPHYVLPLWVGGYDVYIIIDINTETMPILHKIQKIGLPKNYTGIRL